ncbi:MAG: protein kinase [Betaproteobacteria bacterium]
MAAITTTSGTSGSAADTGLAGQALPLGTRLHEFEIVGFVGEGGFSIVYLARDHTLERTVAIKEYLPGALAGRRGDNTVVVRSEQNRKTFETGLRSFMNEARLLARFDHPALVRVHRYWEANGTAYMVMPYYQGRTLKQLLAEQPDLFTEARLKGLIAPVLAALEVLHEHQCYHRDVSPDNILVQPNGVAVLLDFGAARRSIADSTQAFTVILKPGFAPVEQYTSDGDMRQGAWTDVYAVAAVLYTAIVRKPPPTSVGRVINDSCVPLAQRDLPAYTRAFRAGIDRGLAVLVEQRPQSIAELRGLLGIPGPERAPATSGLDADAAFLPAREPAQSAFASSKPDLADVAEVDQSTVLFPVEVAGARKSGGHASAAADALPRIARRPGIVTAAALALALIAAVATWVYFDIGGRGRAQTAPPVTGFPGTGPGAAPQRAGFDATTGAKPPAAETPQRPPTQTQTQPGSPMPANPQSQPQLQSQPKDTGALPDPRSAAQQSAPVTKTLPNPASGRANSRRAEEDRAPGKSPAPARADTNHPSAKADSIGAPSKEQCRDWQIRVSIGELLTPQERTLFNTRCQL